MYLTRRLVVLLFHIIAFCIAMRHYYPHIQFFGAADEAEMDPGTVFEKQRRKDLDEKMKGMIREVLFYIVFLFLLLAVIDGQQDNSSFQQNQNLAYSMTSPGLSNVVSGIREWHGSGLFGCMLHLIYIAKCLTENGRPGRAKP